MRRDDQKRPATKYIFVSFNVLLGEVAPARGARELGGLDLNLVARRADFQALPLHHKRAIFELDQLL